MYQSTDHNIMCGQCYIILCGWFPTATWRPCTTEKIMEANGQALQLKEERERERESQSQTGCTSGLQELSVPKNKESVWIQFSAQCMDIYTCVHVCTNHQRLCWWNSRPGWLGMWCVEVGEGSHLDYKSPYFQKPYRHQLKKGRTDRMQVNWSDSVKNS